MRSLPWPVPVERQELLLLAFLLPFVLAPSSIERHVAHAISARQFRSGGWLRAHRLRKFPPQLANGAGLAAVRLARESEEESIQERIRLLRAIVFPWWKRRLTVHGLSNVREGRATGNGVILWVHHCAESNVAVKQAMASAGFPLVHLSRPAHPFSAQPFSIRVLNPVLRRPEVRFLAERVPIADANTIAPLRRLQSVLAENRVVSITVTRTAGAVERFPLLGGTIALPTGPVRLSLNTGAPLLPVFTWGAGGQTHVEIGRKVALARARPDDVRAALAESVQWLEARVRKHPQAWIAWRSAEFSAEPAPAAARG